MAISRHVLVACSDRPGGIRLRYNEVEDVQSADEVQHPLLRVLLQEWPAQDIELTTISDLPGNSGLGSSGAFLVCCLAARFRAKPIWCAEIAYDLEREKLGRTVGLQDPYAAALGGVGLMNIHETGEMHVSHPFAREAVESLGQHIALFALGEHRSASDVLVAQANAWQHLGSDASRAQMHIADIGRQTIQALGDGRVSDIGHLWYEHWEQKRRLSSGVSTPRAETAILAAVEAGATGGKILGAGGGGHIGVFRAPAQARAVEASLVERGLTPIPYRPYPRGVVSYDTSRFPGP